MANFNPKVSVLMATHNGQRFIKEAIDSILGQTFGDFEFLIVDDGSTDLTPSILSEYAKKDQRITIIANSERLGLTKSLNKLIKQAKGEYIARMDDDDVNLKDRLEKQLDFMQKNPDIVLLGSFAFLINEKGEIIGEKKLALGSEEIKNKLLFNNQIIHPSWLAKKDILIAEGLYNEQFKKAQDYDFVLRLGAKHKIANLPDNLLKYRVLKDSLSWQNKDQQKFAIKARWQAITKYGYPKMQGMWNILARIAWMYVPKRVKMRKYK